MHVHYKLTNMAFHWICVQFFHSNHWYSLSFIYLPSCLLVIFVCFELQNMARVFCANGVQHDVPFIYLDDSNRTFEFFLQKDQQTRVTMLAPWNTFTAMTLVFSVDFVGQNSFWVHIQYRYQGLSRLVQIHVFGFVLFCFELFVKMSEFTILFYMNNKQQLILLFQYKTKLNIESSIQFKFVTDFLFNFNNKRIFFRFAKKCVTVECEFHLEFFFAIVVVCWRTVKRTNDTKWNWGYVSILKLTVTNTLQFLHFDFMKLKMEILLETEYILNRSWNLSPLTQNWASVHSTLYEVCMSIFSKKINSSLYFNECNLCAPNTYNFQNLKFDIKLVL